MTSNTNCCVFGCTNTYRNTTNVKFYKFPSKSWEKDRRSKWILFAKRKT